MLLRLGSIGITAIVARILSPRDFGVFAVATTVFIIVSAFGEFGVTSCLARADLDVDALAPTLWTVSLLTSLIMAGVLYEFALPIATALGSPAATRPVRVMALVLVIWGASAVPTAQLVRDFRQDKLFLANAVSFVPSMAVLLFLAKHGSGAMAFAWSRVVGQSLSCAVVLLYVPKRHLPGMARGALAILFKFGLPLACANFVGYVLQNVDYAFIGHFIGPVMLGTYVVAFNAASWSSTLLGGVLNSVALPAFSRVKHDAVKLRAAMGESLRVVVLIAAPMCTLAMVLARPIVLTLYGARWASAAPVLSILALYGLISVTGVLFASMLAALGRSKFVLGVQLIWLFGLVPAMAIGVHERGIVGAAIAHIVIIGPIVLPCYLIALKRATGVRVSMLARSASLPLASAVVAAGLAWLTASQFHSPLIQLLAGLTVGGSLYTVLTAPQLILLVARDHAMHPRVTSILHGYDNVSRLLRLRFIALCHLIELRDSAPQAIAVGEPLSADLKRLLGPDHSDTLTARNSLAAHLAAGRTDEAIPLSEQTSTAPKKLAAAYRAGAQAAEAPPLVEQTLTARRSQPAADAAEQVLASFRRPPADPAKRVLPVGFRRPPIDRARHALPSSVAHPPVTLTDEPSPGRAHGPPAAEVQHDREVAAAFAAGEPAGIAIAYDRYAPALYGYCHWLLRGPADAAAALQDTFVVAAATFSDLSDASKLRPWL
jgi:PST family polysaccharide transporter